MSVCVNANWSLSEHTNSFAYFEHVIKSASRFALSTENDLVEIEHTRYEIRQLKYLFDENVQKEQNVLLHRKMLDNLSDSLGSMLNNLDVEPTLNLNESVDGEFDINKSPFSRDNEIYKVFSMEAIEKIFSGKGRENP